MRLVTVELSWYDKGMYSCSKKDSAWGWFTTAIALIIAVLNISGVFLYPLKQALKFDHFSLEDGLSQSSVNCILKDRRGLMWFGTQDGLNRYDGYTFKVFRHEPGNPTSLSNSYIYSIYEDHKGVLWVGTRSGLNQFDREQETFIHYKNDKESPFKISNNEVTAICEDQDGYLWIGTSGGGLNMYDFKEDRFVFYRHDIYNSTSISSNNISTLYIDADNTIWIGTQDRGLDRFDQNSKKFIHYQHNSSDSGSISNNFVTAIRKDKAGKLWIGTNNGLNYLDPKTNTFIHYLHYPKNPGSISNQEIHCIHVGHEGELLVGTDDGLNLYNPGEKTFSCWKTTSSPYSLSNNIIQTIFEDSAHILWIGTNGGGFNKYAPNKNRFAHYQFDPHKPSKGLSGKMVYAIYEDRSGIIWIGTNRGLNRFDPEKNDFTAYPANSGDSRGLNSDYIFAIFEDRFGILWVGTWGGGLNEFDRKSGYFTYYLSNFGSDPRLNTNIVRRIYEDQQGVLWIGTEGGGLCQFDREKKTFSCYQTSQTDTNTISNNYIRSIVEDSSGTLWIGTKNGLNRFDRSSGHFIRYHLDDNISASLSNNEVNVIYPGGPGVIWLGTSGGLDKFDLKNQRITHFRKSDGLPNNVICGILEDQYGNLWISTNKGLSKFDPRLETFRNYGTKDGLQSNEFNFGAYCKTFKGKIAFGGINGFNLFHPDEIKDNPIIPPIIITEFRIFHQSATKIPYSPLKKSILETTEIKLSHRARVFSFEFAALDYTSPLDNKYAYMMEGLDLNWIDAGERRFATYTTLPPGEYTFRVKGTNSDGIWNETGTSLKMFIRPPFWRTWWFLSIVILVATALFFALYQARTRSIRKRTKHLEEINKALNREITERKLAEEKVQKSERRLRTFIDTASEGFLEMDNQERILDFNPEMCAILNCTREELLSHNFLDFIAPPDITKFLEKEIRRNGKRSTYSLSLVRPDKTIAHCLVKTAPLFDENQNVKGSLAMVTNITEIVQAEQELHQTKNYLNNVFNSLSSMLISVTPEGVITQWNTAAQKYIGVPAEWAVSKRVWDVVPFLKSYRDQLEKVHSTRKPVVLHRERVEMRKGEAKYLDIVIYPLAYEKMAGSVIRMDDVTELEKKDRQLIQAQKMETVGNLAGGLAHDFNNVLGGIIGTVSLIKYLLERDKKISLEKLKLTAETIEKGASRAVNLVNQLLTLSRKNEPSFASVDLNEGLDDVMKICENTFDKSIKLEVSYSEHKAMVWADISQIQQVILNLCINASHAMTMMRKIDDPQGGTLSVSILSFYADQQFCASQPEAIEGNYWVIKVTDTGVGIEPEQISKIFDPFFTTKTKSQGTGLGLAMVYNIVQQHNGFIEVYSQPGQGTTFSVYLPQLDEQNYLTKHFASKETLTRGSGLILLVDDEESLRLSLKEILETCGYNVLLAEDGKHGVRIYKERHSEIKLILLDLAMPNMAGKESYMEMKKINPLVKVLLISGLGNDCRIKDILALGANGFLQKPFTMVELSKKIAEIIRS